MKKTILTPAAGAVWLALGIVAHLEAHAQAAASQQRNTGASPTQAEPQPPQSTSQSDAGATGMNHDGMNHGAMQHQGMVHEGQAQPGATSEGAPQQGTDHQQMQQPPGASGEPQGANKPAQPHQHQPGMTHAMPGMDMGGSGHGSQTGQMQGMRMGEGMQMGQGMQMGPMQGGKPPPDARDPNAYAEGTHYANLPGNEMNDMARFGRVLVNNAEFANGDGEHGQNLDAEAWYGDDYNKVWLKAEGERRDGRLDTLRMEALWDRVFATYWSTQVGVRHDTGSGESRDWLAVGVQGLAPYWFETEATAYWRPGGFFAARADVRYELLFTQRLILEPELQANLYSKADPERGLGSGFSDIELGLRLRYEIRRQFGPYVGVTWNRKFGGTARFSEAEGRRRQTVQAVAGVRIWF